MNKVLNKFAGFKSGSIGKRHGFADSDLNPDLNPDPES
jgi:hypothetical protein